jgi:broad specificity phosphatase PhoE
MIISRRLVVLTVVALTATALEARAQNAIFLVRHAEKVDESTDAALSEAGLRRAETLAKEVGTAGVTAIYTTHFQRTVKTAEPLARRLKLTMTSADTPPAELIRNIRKQQPKGIVLIVGHSNTIPELMTALGHPTPVQIGPDEYDNLFVVVPRTSGAPTVLRLKY